MKRPEFVVDLVKAAFIVLIVKVMATSSKIIPWNALLDSLSIVFALSVMMLKLLRHTFRLKTFLALSAVSLMVLYTCVSIGQYDLLVSLVAICLVIDEDLKSYITLMLKVQVAILLFHVAIAGLMSLTGLSTNFWLWTNDRYRFKGGFNHPNTISSYILSCIMMFSWLRFRRITANEFGWLVCVVVISFLLTKTRTALLLNIALLFILFYAQRGNRLVIKCVDFITPLLFPIISLMTYWVQTHYYSGGSIITILDKLLTGRVKYAAYAYLRSGTTWLPRYLDYVETRKVMWTPEWNLNTFTFDCLYSYLFIQQGMIWIGIITVIIFFLCRKIDFRNKLFLLIWIINGLVEVHGLNCFKFFPILLLSMLLSEKGGRGSSELQ